MAEIKLERKKRPIWPWVLLALLLLLLIIWAVIAAMRPGEPEAVPTVTAIGDTAVPVTTDTAAVAAGAPLAGGLPRELDNYMRTCSVAEGAEPETMGREHEFSTNCLELLADSMSAVAAQRPSDPNITQQIDSVRQQVSEIRQSEATSLQHSNATRRAADAAAAALSTMQQAFSGTDEQARQSVEQVRGAAQQIQATQPLLEQKDALRSFFTQAGTALQSLAAGQPAR